MVNAISLHRYVGVAVVAVSFCLNACTADNHTPKVGEQIAEAPSTAYPKGTVGGDASDYTLAMPNVRKWFSAMSEIERRARTDSSLHIAINYAFNSATASHVTAIENNPALLTTLQSKQLTPREFVILTALVGTSVVALDQLNIQKGETALKLDTGIVKFVKANRVELDSLKATLP